MTKEENRPAGCVLRLFGVPEQTVQKAVETLPDTWQGTVHCRTRGAETLVALQSSTPQQLHRAVQQLRTSLAPALYGEGEQTLAAAAVQALEQHRKLLVCSDAAAGALLETRLSAQELLRHLLDIEHCAGRRRDAEAAALRWGPRVLDLDLLLYASEVIHGPGLRVPHPHMHERAFVLVPLADIAPEAEIPGHCAVAQALRRVDAGGIVPIASASA